MSNNNNNKITRLPVQGMTCQSCVRAITNALLLHTGVETVTVDLNHACTTITYDPLLITWIDLKNGIEDCGFDVNITTVMLPVLGMTCQSCVKAIHNALGDKDGIVSVDVSLENEECTVVYDPLLTTTPNIAEMIEDCGFDVLMVHNRASSSSSSSSSSKVILEEEKRSHSSNEKKPLQQQQQQDQYNNDTTTIQLEIHGMTCESRMLVLHY
jgi:Cu+-exporting ATPase